MKDLQKISEDPEKQVYADYVLMVLSGTKKSEALKACFPERYDAAVERAAGNQQVVNANVTKAVRQLERAQVVQELYEKSHKTWWIEFLEKKHRIYENLYSLALDENVNARERVSASKVMLEHMPTFQEDIHVKVEVKQTKEDFVEKLREMQLKLHNQANKKIEDVQKEQEELYTEAEVVDN
jgi:hypothetical protein